MAIGKIITIDDKLKRVVGKVSGSLLMKGPTAHLTGIYQGDSDWFNKFERPKVDPLENYFFYTIKGPLGTDIDKAYRLEVISYHQGKDGRIYGSLDLGHFGLALPFLKIPSFDQPIERLPSGGTEWPLWQENELSGYNLPLMDSSGQSFLEKICFGKAEWSIKKRWGHLEYVVHKNLFTEHAAEEVVGINREQFGELAKPIEEQLRKVIY